MAAPPVINSNMARKINLLCLALSILVVFLLPLKKEIWYDETISVICSKGLNHQTLDELAHSSSTTSADLEHRNTLQGVYTATVYDNSNSLLFNVGLHYFTLLCGNSVSAYMLFSKLCGALTLLVFYRLCRYFFGESLYTSLALLLLGMDINFLGMSHEIRAYALGILMVTLAASYCYKFLYRDGKPVDLFVAGMCSAGAILSHFLSVYIILVLLGAIVIRKKARVFTAGNILAMAIPVALLGAFFYFSYAGLQTMNEQNRQIRERAVNADFSIAGVFLRAMRFTAINFKLSFPAFTPSMPVLVMSFLLAPLLFLFGWKAANHQPERRNLALLCISGISGTIFLSVLSIKAHHYTSLYFRYFSFCLPFCSLYTAYLVYVIRGNSSAGKMVKTGIVLLFLLPAGALFVTGTHPAVKQKYNHIAVAGQVVQEHVSQIEVPEWSDALLIQAFLPRGYQLDYVLSPAGNDFVLHNGLIVERIKAVKEPS